jgi:hypothetical protein
MATYQLTIEMSPPTVQALQQSGSMLYALQAVQGPGGGEPLAWVQTGSFAENTTLGWSDGYQAFTAQSTATVVVSVSVDIAPGQTFVVPAGTVQNEGVAGAIGILNQGTQPTRAGIGLKSGASSSPLCAFPLYGGGLLLVVPTQQVFLMFSGVSGQSAVPQSLGPGVLVDMAGGGERQVTFDVNEGWSWGGFSWARAYPPLTDLTTLLIQPYPQLSPSSGVSDDASGATEEAATYEAAAPADDTLSDASQAAAPAEAAPAEVAPD